MTSLRPRTSAGKNLPVFSARYWRIAPDSKTLSGPLPSAGSLSTIAGIRLFSEIFRNSGVNCSPLEILTGLIEYASPASSRKIVILCPFGVVQ
jgi:hypothetical protein